MSNKDGAPLKASQRRRAPPASVAPPPFRVGDKVKWNDRYEGRVLAVDGDMATIAENDRSVRWCLRVDFLQRVP
jgi:hypothetical protein